MNTQPTLHTKLVTFHKTGTMITVTVSCGKSYTGTVEDISTEILVLKDINSRYLILVKSIIAITLPL